MAAIRVLIVDDHRLFVDAVRATLQHFGAEEIIVAYNGSDGVAAAKANALDVALVDIELPDRSGLSVGREIMDVNPRTLVVALTAVQDAMIARQALKLGFAAYLPKDISVDIFEQVLRDVLGQRLDLPTEPLTESEKQVLERMARGMNSHEIETDLDISKEEVRSRAQSILVKLGVHSRLEADAFNMRPPPSPDPPLPAAAALAVPVPMDIPKHVGQVVPRKGPRPA